MATKYAEIVHWIKTQVSQNELGNGDKLPTEQAMMDLFTVSRHTVRKALHVLAADGLIETRQGSGVFIHVKPEMKRCAFLTFSLDSYIFSKIISGINSVFFHENIDISLYSSDYSSQNEDSILQVLLKKDIDGLIFTPVNRKDYTNVLSVLEKYRKKEIPVVFLDTSIPGVDASTVGLGDENAGMKAAEYLKENNGTKALILFGTDHQGMLARKNSFEVGAHRLGLETVSLGIPLAEHREIGTHLHLSHIKDTDCAFCTNDQLAYALLQYLKTNTNTKNTYEQVKRNIIGFDNSEISRILEFPSFSHPQEQAGKTAARLLLNAMESYNTIAAQNVLFESKIAEHNS